jgi:hypothetical protein
MLVFCVSVYLLFVHAWIWVLTTPLALSGRADFRQFYATGAMIRAGEAKRLYDYATQKEFQDRLVSPEPTALPFVSPAYHALFFVPLSLLSYRDAYSGFLAVNVITLGVTFALLRTWMKNLRVIYPWLPPVMFLTFMPIIMALIQGQDSILLTGILAGSFVLLTREQNFLGGALAGLGLFKFQITLPIAFVFLVWRRWRFLLGFAASGITVATFSLLLAGVEQTKLYIASLASIAGLTRPPSDLARYPITLEQMANLHGLLFGTCGGWMSRTWLHVATISLSAVLLTWTALRGFCVKPSSTLFLLAIPCSVLVGHHTYVHDLSVLLLPIIVLLNTFVPSEAVGDPRGWLINRTAAVMFVAPVVESFSANHFFLVSLAVLGLLVGVAAAAKLEKTTLHVSELATSRDHDVD